MPARNWSGASRRRRRPRGARSCCRASAASRRWRGLPAKYREPVLVSGTDGVGTKLKLAIDHDRHDSVGQDLVAMCVNDVLVTGAEPFLFLDYYATAALDVDVAERVINGIARGCKLAGCALVGGETAEMPGFYQRGDYDLAGFCVGVVEQSRIVDGSRLGVGDVLIGLPSSGPHSNGYSLIRRLLADTRVTVDDALLDLLMAPTRIYARTVLALLEAHPVHAMAHITGGGIVENLPRIFDGAATPGLAALVNLDGWPRPDVFAWMQQAGNIDEDEMLRTFNCGIGFIVVVPADAAEAALATLEALGEAPRMIGRLVDADARPGPGERLIP